VSFSDEEHAELIGALSRTADMVAGLLDALDISMRQCWRRASFMASGKG
jgi:hypothetical protein